MDKIKLTASNAVEQYFDTLINYGTINNCSKNKMVAYVLIEDLLNGVLEKFITEDDLRLINKYASCLSFSSCLIPVSVFRCNNKGTEIPVPITAEPIFITTKDGYFLVSQNDDRYIVLN